MSILSKLSKGGKDEAQAEVTQRECGHWELAPRWSCNEDIGKADKVTFYTCASCGETVSVEEARNRPLPV